MAIPPFKPFDPRSRCLGCMYQFLDNERLPDGSVRWITPQKCPVCGLPVGFGNRPSMLPSGTFLAGRYFVGNSADGYGPIKWWGPMGYIGYDITGGKTVLIYELWSLYAQRDPNGYDVTVSMDAEPFRRVKDQFLARSRELMGKPWRLGLLRLLDAFEENGTAYAVCRYDEGTALYDCDAMTMGRALDVFRWAVDALQGLHEAGMLHLAVEPANILVTWEGKARLLPFDPHLDVAAAPSSTIAPPPVHMKAIECFGHGEIGPWTDVYALAGTMYYALTKKVPPEAGHRTFGDELTPPSALGAKITPGQEQALLKGLALHPEERYQSVRAFYDAMRA